MISFEPIKTLRKCKERLSYSSENEEIVRELVEQFGDDVAICREPYGDLFRVFDGEKYAFIYPRSLKEEEAVEAIREYAVREEIGLLFRRVPGERLSFLLSKFLYSDVRREPYADGYSVRVRSECDLLSRAPSVRGKVTLSAIRRSDISAYAEICREKSALEYWGYDYRDDVASPSDEYFYNGQLSEFCRGVCLTMGVRYRGRLIGEASFYAFDFKGGAEISFRLLPEYRGRGLGRLTLEAILSVAEEIGLSVIYATVDKRNTPSLSLLSQYMDEDGERDGRKRFVLRGEEI